MKPAATLESTPRPTVRRLHLSKETLRVLSIHTGIRTGAIPVTTTTSAGCLTATCPKGCE